MSYHPPALPANRFNDRYLEGFTVCVHYADFLRETLRRNLHHFDHFVVVTSPDDHETQALCNAESVTCVVTDAMYDDGEPFAKGMAINLGIAHLRAKGWICHLDADIALPDRFRTMLSKSGLERQCIYGADRVNVLGWERWTHLRDTPRRQFRHHCLVNVEPLPLGSRLVHAEYGYAPIGFFQLWHASAAKRYPVNQGSAEHTDVLFALQWSRTNRRLLPTIICHHLESEPARLGANWLGRTTQRFAPAAPSRP